MLGAVNIPIQIQSFSFTNYALSLEYSDSSRETPTHTQLTAHTRGAEHWASYSSRPQRCLWHVKPSWCHSHSTGMKWCRGQRQRFRTILHLAHIPTNNFMWVNRVIHISHPGSAGVSVDTVRFLPGCPQRRQNHVAYVSFLCVHCRQAQCLGRLLLWQCGCLCVCHVDVLCPNGWVDHHATFTRL